VAKGAKFAKISANYSASNLTSGGIGDEGISSARAQTRNREGSAALCPGEMLFSGIVYESLMPVNFTIRPIRILFDAGRR